MFWDYSIRIKDWQEMPADQQRQRRIHIRAYFLWQNGMPGSDMDHRAIAEFEDQFDGEFYQMECKRSAFHTLPEERIRLLVIANLVGILRMDPRQITNDTPIPQDPALRTYLRQRVKHESFASYSELYFTAAKTVGELVGMLQTWDNLNPLL